MKKLILLILILPVVSYGQTSNVTVYDEYGNNLGTYRVQSEYASQYSNDFRMAVRDYINYLEASEDKAHH